MEHGYRDRHVTDEQRREFLAALGVGGAVAAGGATLDDVRTELTAERSSELATVGEAIRADLAGELDAELLAEQATAFADAAGELTAVPGRGLPTGTEPRDDFAQVAAAARPAYDHLVELGFFESTTERLPEFTPEYIETSVQRFVASEPLAAPLSDLGVTPDEAVDLLTTVVAHRRLIGDRHWVATDQLPRERLEFGEHIPPMTRAAAGGVLLWLDDLDEHLWTQQVLISDEMLADATWDARAMSAGFGLMLEGARRLADGGAAGAADRRGGESRRSDDAELAGLLSSGFALQAIAQSLLPNDAYWITEEMRDERRTDLSMPE